jgi:peptidoglycan/LPS O-acetylase OafA/YrhL
MLGAWARAVPAFVPLLLALLSAAACALVGRHWSRSAGWSDRHRLAVVLGALLAAMAAGFVSNDLSDPVNLIGKIVLNVVAVGALALLAGKVRRAASPTAE